MPKRPLSHIEAFDLRQALHVATLDALMASRRWEPGQIAFQGGTSLHLAYGSPRFSEDLDFLVDDSLRIDSIGPAVRQRLGQPGWLPAGTSLTVSKAQDARNPHAFVVTVGGDDVIGAVRVKVELWRAPGKVLSSIAASVRPVRLARGPQAGMQAFVPVEELPEILADKVFALAARAYLKPRDVFDLHWLKTVDQAPDCTQDDLRRRLLTYPSTLPEDWLCRADTRRDDLLDPVTREVIGKDLKRWLPTSWSLDVQSVDMMAETAITYLDAGIALMRKINAENEAPLP
jgi:hypothetical protein